LPLPAIDNSAGGQFLQAAFLGTWYQVGSVGGADSQATVFRVGGAAGSGNTVTLDSIATSGTIVSIAFKSKFHRGKLDHAASLISSDAAST